MAAPVPLHADRGDGRTYTAADRCRSGKTSTHGGLTDGHLKLHPDLHHLDGRDLISSEAPIGTSEIDAANSLVSEISRSSRPNGLKLSLADRSSTTMGQLHVAAAQA